MHSKITEIYIVQITDVRVEEPSIMYDNLGTYKESL